jgi:glycosyltransferase involved in cell wall biosynthesis
VHGLVVPISDPDALIAALDDSLTGVEQARRRAARARQRVESELSFEARMRAVEAIYADLMGRQERPVAA